MQHKNDSHAGDKEEEEEEGCGEQQRREDGGTGYPAPEDEQREGGRPRGAGQEGQCVLRRGAYPSAALLVLPS